MIEFQAGKNLLMVDLFLKLNPVSIRLTIKSVDRQKNEIKNNKKYRSTGFIV